MSLINWPVQMCFIFTSMSFKLKVAGQMKSLYDSTCPLGNMKHYIDNKYSQCELYIRLYNSSNLE